MPENDKKIISIPLEINWHEGMLLSQHHFQQNDLRNFQVLSEKLSLLSQYNYGIKLLKYDNNALANGLFRINKIEAILPDGTLLCFDPQETPSLHPLEIDISIVDQFLSQDLTIYIVITEKSKTHSTGAKPRYYVIPGVCTKDDNLEDNEINIPRLFPNVFLHIGNTIPSFSVGFPICKVNKINGSYIVKDWTPPCFYINENTTTILWNKCIKLAQLMREKATILYDKLRNSTNENTKTDTQHILRQFKVIIPGFEAFIYSSNINPHDLYLYLANILGNISTLIPTELPPVINVYDHNDIDSSVYPIIEQIEKYLSVIERGYVIIQFNKRERFFYKYITQNNFNNISNKKLYIGIRCNSNITQSDINNWMKDAIIVSDFALDTVRAKRVQGAIRRLLPNEIVIKILPSVGTVLYEIEADPKFIKAEQNLHIFNPGSNIQPSEIILYLPRNHEG